MEEPEYLQPGSSLGELAVICGRPWNQALTVTASQHSDMYTITEPAVWDVLQHFKCETKCLKAVLETRTKDYITTQEVNQLHVQLRETYEHMQSSPADEADGSQPGKIEAGGSPTN